MELVFLLLAVCICPAVTTSSKCSFSITQFGAKGDGKTLNTKAIQQTIDIVHTNCTTGDAVVPSGIFLTGTIYLKSNVNLLLESIDSQLLASDQPQNFPCVKTDLGDNGSSPCEFVLVAAINASNIGMSGPGQLNGAANQPPGHLVHYYNATTNMLRPLLLNFTCPGHTVCRDRIKLVRFIHSRNILIKGTRWLRSPGWTSAISHCENIMVDSLHIWSDRRWPNNDGIDPISVRNMTIQNSVISTGDDSICLSTQNGALIDLTVRNCSLQSTSAALKIGHWATDLVKNVLFQDITITDSNRGCALMPRRGGGSIENVTFRNIDIQTRMFSTPWWGNAEPIYVTSLSQSPDINSQQHYTGTIQNVKFENIRAVSESGVLLYANTSTAHRMYDIMLSSVVVTVGHWSNVTHSRLDLRPSEGENPLPMVKTHGMWVESGTGVNIQNSTVHYNASQPEPYYGECLKHVDVEITSSNFTCKNP